MVKCPWCGKEIPTEEYDRHYSVCKKAPPQQLTRVKKEAEFYGIKAILTFRDRHKGTLRNVTEIHYNYQEAPPYGRPSQRVAFESSIHGTGVTYPISDIDEFEATLEEEIAPSF